MNAIQKSARARINRVIRESELLNILATECRENPLDGMKMQQLRDTAENILQCVHEFNAYTNASNI